MTAESVKTPHPSLKRGPLPLVEGQFTPETDPRDIIRWALAAHPDLLMPSAFNLNGVVLLDLAVQAGYRGKVVFVDTGYHFPETLATRDRLEGRYPELTFVTLNAGATPEDGQTSPDLYVSDPDACCAARKVDPLQQYLKQQNPSALLNARSRDQASTRADIPFVEEGGARRKVNPLALEEFAALEERHTFLVTQLEDVKNSRTDLRNIIRQVDQHVEEVFSQAYRDTAEQFVEVFATLFPGGEGRLRLTDPDEMLTTGVEVEARPSGKKIKRLSLLSGGERSLTALALLVAIFKARPSPFYVMDEVEAALDDRNLGRLLTIFEQLKESSQLIIVTHQKRTMEIADALYGVSMRGDGVSLVVGQQLSQLR